ncbi:glycosyltransferase family 4 protein [Chryseolinea sp. T2]|uniref:glycosyltransferase family 4 protein n=1 Tax=Chryseolinea sp. T2 TaxID=3129255 RepID=UPI003078A027
MKILIIHQHFRLPSQGGAIRSYYLARALVEHGIDVEVITAHAGKKQEHQNVDGISIHYLPVDYENSFGFRKRSQAFISFAWRAAALAARLPGIDLCYAISVPLTTGLSAMWLKATERLNYLFEVGDLWPDAPIELGFVENGVFKAALLKLESITYSKAAGIVALSDPIRKAVQRKSPGSQVYVIPNMADTEYFGTSADGTAFRTRHGVAGKFVVSYIGAVGFANGLDHYIECARAASQAKLNVHFFICGDGALLPQHQANVKRLDLQNLTFLPFSDRAGVKELMDASDAIFVSYKPYRILETGSPNKYFDGLAAGKLIVVNFEGWIREEIEGERCGIYVDRQRPDAFVSVITPFLNDRALLKQYQIASRDLALRKYSRIQLGAQFADVIKRTVNACQNAGRSFRSPKH